MSIIFNLLVSDNLEWSHNSRFEIGTQRPRLFFCFSFFFLRQTAFAESPQVFSSTLSRPCSPFEREIIELTHFHVRYRLIHFIKRCFTGISDISNQQIKLNYDVMYLIQIINERNLFKHFFKIISSIYCQAHKTRAFF